MSGPLKDRYKLAFKLYPYARHEDQDAQTPRHVPIVIAGAGPVGLCLALDLGLKGHRVIVLDDHEGVGEGSRAICFAKRTLEIAHRLGIGERLLKEGVVWQKGRVFHDRDEIYAFNLLPEQGHRFPAFINLSQMYFEKIAFEAIQEANAKGAQIDVRGKNRVDGVTQFHDHALVDVMTPDGAYQLKPDWMIACDGARSPIRNMLGLGFEGRVFEDNFLIADVKMKADFPTERWFWFEPWFKSGASALLHKQPNDIWRIDFQLGWDIDREAELKTENIRARVDMMLGSDVEYELDWSSIYTFQCRRMEKFVHDNVIFAGDSAHQVSPFGARGANSGIQDIDNLGFKLDLILKGHATPKLLESYDRERIYAADENILNSTRSTDFLTPKSEMSKTLRNAVLDLARHYEFARPLVNSGRLSMPSTYVNLPDFAADKLPQGPSKTRPGAPCSDAPLDGGFLLDKLGNQFTLLALNTPLKDNLEFEGLEINTLQLASSDLPPMMRERYLGGQKQAVYLLRPDQHVVGRWAKFDPVIVTQALKTSLGVVQ